MTQVDFNYRLFSCATLKRPTDNVAVDSRWDIFRPVLHWMTNGEIQGQFLSRLPACPIPYNGELYDDDTPRFLNAMLYDIGVRFSITEHTPLPLFQTDWTSADLQRLGETHSVWYIMPVAYKENNKNLLIQNYHFIKDFDPDVTYALGDIENGGLRLGEGFTLIKLYQALSLISNRCSRLPPSLENHRVYGMHAVRRSTELYADAFDDEQLGLTPAPFR